MLRAFFFHYNRPATRKAGSPKLTLHYKYQCHIVDHVICNTPVRSVHRKSQPRCIIRGTCSNVQFEENTGITTAIIT